MAENTKISWTDHTFNPWVGCTKVAEGCKFCYAEQLMDTRYGKVQWGPNGTRVLTSPANWKLPLKWNREAEKLGVRARVFCASLADVFEDWSGPVLNHKGGVLMRSTDGYVIGDLMDDPAKRVTLNKIRRDLFDLIDATPNLDWLLLTKRPENVRRMWPTERVCDIAACYGGGSPAMADLQKRYENVWPGTSIATQADADKNIPELLKLRDLAPVLFVSAEPLVEAVEVKFGFGQYVDQYGNWRAGKGIDWLIIGGESGPHARPCDLAWIRSIKDQCAAAGVACFVKQIGSKAEAWDEADRLSPGTGPHVSNMIKDPKGGDPDEWPADLRVREFPKTEETQA